MIRGDSMNHGRQRLLSIFVSLVFVLSLSACGQYMTASAETEGKDLASDDSDTAFEHSFESAQWIGNGGKEDPNPDDKADAAGVNAEQILEGETGSIHYSYYLPKGYDESREYPLMMAMPGYDMMWFGDSSSGANLNWQGFLCWTELPEDMIVVSAQLEDWGETSARQAIELTEYFIDNFSVDTNRIYAAGYSAGGETMSRAVSRRPDLFAAYLHGASRWDGKYDPIAENGVAVYIFMAKNDEYYGSQQAWDAYNGLYEAYRKEGMSDEDIAQVLQIQTPDNEWFAERGIAGNYHGGGNVVFEEDEILEWIVAHQKKQMDNSVN